MVVRMTFLQAVLMAIFQGVTELFPVSSLGHAVILPTLLGWNFDQQSLEFLPFLVVLHVGTAAALLVYFWREWLRLFMAALRRSETNERNLIMLLIVGTLPAVFFGFVFEKWFRHLFSSAFAAAWFLVVNGVVLFAGERFRRRAAEIERQARTRTGGVARCSARRLVSGERVVSGHFTLRHHNRRRLACRVTA